MRSLNNYITEKFQVSKDNISTYSYHPKTRDELINCIKEKIKKEGLGTKDNPLDLNDIDTSKITDMNTVFSNSEDGVLKELSANGYFDISDWDVSNVTNMRYMFYFSSFDGDISDWDVSSVKNMRAMFWNSKFSGDIDDWDVSNVDDMYFIFAYAPLSNNPPKWYRK